MPNTINAGWIGNTSVLVSGAMTDHCWKLASIKGSVVRLAARVGTSTSARLPVSFCSRSLGQALQLCIDMAAQPAGIDHQPQGCHDAKLKAQVEERLGVEYTHDECSGA